MYNLPRRRQNENRDRLIVFDGKSTQACAIFAAVSALISFLIMVFFAASSEITNLLRFCAATGPAATASAAAANVSFIKI